MKNEALIKTAVRAGGLFDKAASEDIALLQRINQQDLELLQENRIDSVYFYFVDRNAIAQKVYNAIWQSQINAVSEFTTKASALNIDVVSIQGMSTTQRLFNNFPINRRDCDFLLRKDHMQKAMECLQSIGYQKALINLSTGELISENEETKKVFEKSLSMKERYDFESGIVRVDDFDVDPEIKNTLPDVLAPVRLVNGKFIIYQTFDIIYSYGEFLPTNIYWDYVIKDSKSAASHLTAELELITFCHRLYEAALLGRQDRLRLVIEIARIISSQDIDWKEVRIILDQCQLDSAFYETMHLIDEIFPEFKLLETLKDQGTVKNEQGKRLTIQSLNQFALLDLYT